MSSTPAVGRSLWRCCYSPRMEFSVWSLLLPLSEGRQESRIERVRAIQDLHSRPTRDARSWRRNGMIAEKETVVGVGGAEQGNSAGGNSSAGQRRSSTGGDSGGSSGRGGDSSSNSHSNSNGGGGGGGSGSGSGSGTAIPPTPASSSSNSIGGQPSPLPVRKMDKLLCYCEEQSIGDTTAVGNMCLQVVVRCVAVVLPVPHSQCLL